MRPLRNQARLFRAARRAAQLQDERDQADIAALARAGLIDAQRFRMRALEALDYYVGSTERVRTSIDIACSAIQAAVGG